jgi:Fe/S biogenesis protein NfuA
MITFTDRARAVVLSLLEESEGELEALRITMKQADSGLKPHFDLTLVGTDERESDDQEEDVGGFSILVKEYLVNQLEGATVDYVERINESGFEVRTLGLNEPKKSQDPPEGPIADRVREVLEVQVNPAIAAHGGMISLVNVEETDIFVEMSGGCQGCALSTATLRQGVERMLREAIPELTGVHDITDHSSGENPYL